MEVVGGSVYGEQTIVCKLFTYKFTRMESNLVQLSIFLEELKMKRHQVAQLDSELGCLSLQLIERESEVHAKSAHCQQLELKLTKYKQDMKQMIDDFGSRMKSCQDESSRQEAAILEYAEKLRKVQTEKQCLALKIVHFEKQIKEVYEHVRTVINSLPKINKQHEELSESVKAFETKQLKIVETCEMIQLYADRIQKEANGKWKTALESRSNRAELEKKLCTAQAKLHLIEGERNKEDHTIALRKQNEFLQSQLEMSKKRDEKLRLDLQREREERLDLECKHEEVLNQLAHYLSSEQKEAIRLKSKDTAE